MRKLSEKWKRGGFSLRTLVFQTAYYCKEISRTKHAGKKKCIWSLKSGDVGCQMRSSGFFIRVSSLLL